MAANKTFLRRSGAFLLVMAISLLLILPSIAFAVVAVNESPRPVPASSQAVSPFTTPFFVGTQSALQTALNTSNAHITLTASFDISGTFIPAGTFATIDGNGFTSTVTSGNGILVASGAGLTLENVTIQGIGGLTGLVLQHGSEATIADGTSISGFTNSGVRAGSGILTMTGGTISRNSSTTPGGGVSVTGGTFIMSGGTINENSAAIFAPGGGVSVQNGGTFTMSGGEISENSTGWNGGGVFVNNAFGFMGISSTFTMTGGTIGNNTAAIFGGGVRVEAGGTFNMEDGAISSNTDCCCPLSNKSHNIGPSLGPQLMAEIGDVRRFAHKGSLTAFAGVDPTPNQSGTYETKSTSSSKRGSPELRRTLFLVMDCLIKKAPHDDPVFRFLDKKRAEGKPYYVYMTAGANKFLRIYYGKVSEYLHSLESAE